MSSLVNKQSLLSPLGRRLLDLYQSWGYELVVPPMVEYIESLILTSSSVDQKTFKILRF